MIFRLKINGVETSLDAPPDKPLLWVLREDARLPGTKFGCGAGLCGACTVQMDGTPTRSCQLAVSDVGDAEITTIEALGMLEVGRRLRAAWIELDVPQCGYCQAGQLMTAAAFLRDNPNPSDTDIVDTMTANLCRCATYPRIKAAIKRAATSKGDSHD